MAYKLVKTDTGYIPLTLSGDGLILSKLNVEIQFEKWFRAGCDEFKRAGKTHESWLFFAFAELLIQGIYIKTPLLTSLGFSEEFADAWEAGEQSGLHFLALWGVEKVSKIPEALSQTDFDRNLQKIITEEAKRWQK